MPAENTYPTPPEQPHDGWHQLAHDAREHWDLEHPGVAALYENHVVPQLQSMGIGHLATTKDEKSAGQFLHEQNKGSAPLHTSGPVEFTVERAARQVEQKPPQKPAEKLAVYLNTISGRHSLITDTPNESRAAQKLARRRERHIRRHAVDPKVAAREHLKTEARIMYEQGQGADLDSLGINVRRTERGELRFEVPDSLLERPEIIKKGEEKHKLQVETLGEWVEYLNGKDTKYPDWFKYYAIDGVTKLGAFDKEKGRFSRRDADSLAPFPRLSRGALAKVRSWVEDTRLHKMALPAEFDDEDKQKELKSAVGGGNFGQLYVLALDSLNEGRISDELRTITEGNWKIYDQDTDPSDLYNDLQGFGLDWCTATDIYTTRDHIDGGGFLVYYSNDEHGEPRVPRIAIRMEHGEVAEVRGIEDRQHLEPAMADISAEKLKNLPGGKKYTQKVEDMKHLTALHTKLIKDPDASLSREDIIFLYELDRFVESFGYHRDPRIDEMQEMRGVQDLAILQEMTIERIREGFRSANQGYQAVAEYLQAVKRSEAELQQLFDAKLEQWKEDGMIDYLVERLINNAERYTLVITPEGLFSGLDLCKLGDHFHQEYPLRGSFPTSNSYWQEKMCDDNNDYYSAEELSGGGELKISLLPDRPTHELGRTTAIRQRQILKDLQADRPNLNLHVPSILTNMTRWFVLLAQGDKLLDADTPYKTYVRAFNLHKIERFYRYGRVYENVIDLPDTFLLPEDEEDDEFLDVWSGSSLGSNCPAVLAVG